MGLDPGMTLTERMAFAGRRSQLIVSPNGGSLRRTPSRYISRPCGAPTTEGEEPAVLKIRLQRIALNVVDLERLPVISPM